MILRRIAVVLLCLFLTTGCWSRRELNELMIVLGVGIDWEDGEYLVSYQVVNPSEISAQRKGGERPPVTLYQGRGKTIFEAARSLTAEAPRKVYLGHLQLYIISEELARRGINDYIDNMLRGNELRMDFNLIVAKNTMARNLLMLYTPLEKLPSNNMSESLETSGKSWAPTVPVTLDQAFVKLSSEGAELVLTSIELIGNQRTAASKHNVDYFLPPSRFRYTGIAAFKGDKLVGWLNEKESKGFTDITDKLHSSSVEFPCDANNYMGFEITSANAYLTTELHGHKPEGGIHLRAEANIVDRPCTKFDLTKPATIVQLQTLAAQRIQSNMMAAVKKAMELKSDIFGFGSQLEKDHPRVWNKVRERWNDEYFPEMSVQYDVKLYIRRTGTIGNTTLR